MYKHFHFFVALTVNDIRRKSLAKYEVYRMSHPNNYQSHPDVNALAKVMKAANPRNPVAMA